MVGVFISNPKIVLIVVITGMYIILNYYISVVFIFIARDKANKKSLYVWLDNLDGNDEFLRKLFLNVKKTDDILVNLEQVFVKINTITGNEKKKMRLLKGYFKTLEGESSFDLLHKTILAIIVALVVWSINKGSIWGVSQFSGNPDEIIISTLYLTCLNFITIIYEGLLFLVVFILAYFKDKKRNKIIIEVIDVCIDEHE